MKKQSMKFAVATQNGVIQKVGHSTLLQPKTNFKGGSIPWYQDKPKKKER